MASRFALWQSTVSHEPLEEAEIQERFYSSYNAALIPAEDRAGHRFLWRASKAGTVAPAGQVLFGEVKLSSDGWPSSSTDSAAMGNGTVQAVVDVPVERNLWLNDVAKPCATGLPDAVCLSESSRILTDVWNGGAEP